MFWRSNKVLSGLWRGVQQLVHWRWFRYASRLGLWYDCGIDCGSNGFYITIWGFGEEVGEVKFVLTVDKEIVVPWLGTSNGRLISLAFWLTPVDLTVPCWTLAPTLGFFVDWDLECLYFNRRYGLPAMMLSSKLLRHYNLSSNISIHV